MPTIEQRVQHKIFAARAEKGAQPNTNVFTLSTDKVDRDGDRLDQGGWNLTAFRQNPVVLFGHDAKSLPIGKCTDIRVVGGKLKGTIEWPPAGIHPFADQVHAMVEGGFLNATSVGFRSLRSEPNAFGGRDHDALELCEWSIVPIGSNTDAQLERGIDHVRLKSWLGKSWREQSKEDTMHYLDITKEDKISRQLAELFEGQVDKDIDDTKDLSSPDWFADQLAAMGHNIPREHEQLLSIAAQIIRDPEVAAVVTRMLQSAGVVAPPKGWHATDDLVEFDDRQVARIIADVIAEEIPRATRSALNSVLGRLD